MLVILAIVSCNNKIDNPKVYAEVYAMNPNIIFPMTIYGCDHIRGDYMKEKKQFLKIDDDKFISRLNVDLKEIKIEKIAEYKNIRYQVIIHQITQVDTLCFGGHFDTYKNGRKVEDSKKLFTILDSLFVWK